MWEPHLDGEKLIDEFVRGYYGEAVAPLIHQYWDALITGGKDENLPGLLRREFGEMDRPGNSQPVTEIMNKAVETATESAGPIPTSPPVAEAKMGVVTSAQPLYPLRAERAAAVPRSQRPFEAARSSPNSANGSRRRRRSSRGKNLANYLQGLKADSWQKIRRKSPGHSGGRTGRVHALSFNNYHDAATIVDVEGWNGRRTDGNEGRLEHQLPAGSQKYRILASLRCEGAIKEGKLGSWGVYDAQGKRAAREHDPRRGRSRPETGRSTASSAGCWASSTTSPAYFWFAHGHSPT